MASESHCSRCGEGLVQGYCPNPSCREYGGVDWVPTAAPYPSEKEEVCVCGHSESWHKHADACRFEGGCGCKMMRPQ